MTLCTTMGVSTSGYYAWLVKPKAIPNPRHDEIVIRTKALFKESYSSFGSRRLSKHLKSEGYLVGRHKARSLMRALDLSVRRKRPYVVTTDSKHNNKVAENLLGRRFNPSSPNQVWTTDITYLKSQSGWVYLAVVIDLYSRQVIGWHVDKVMSVELCTQALITAYWRRKPPKGLLHHSDRGSQYTSVAYQDLLKRFGMICSMSRKANCWDNAPTERFFRSLKHERINWLKMKSLDDVKLEAIDYITWYNSKRLHSTLGYKTPIGCEKMSLEKIA